MESDPETGQTRDHGGDLDRARALYGAGPWLDLSTGINAAPFPLPEIPPGAWAALPTRAETAALETVAQRTYGTRAPVVALAGAQAAIQMVPRLVVPGHARVLAPTYNEHAGALRAQGWHVTTVETQHALAGADLAVVVNPNNPDGRRHKPEALEALARQVGVLIVDESFADPTPEVSLAPRLGPGTDRIVVLRSFGKFFGLAGLRLGFAVTGDTLAGALRNLAGPWAVSGPAIAVGCAALADTAWAHATRTRLSAATTRLDALCLAAGWQLVGGTALFRTYAVDKAADVQTRLARNHVWTRIFPYSASWIRLGLPADEAGWRQLDRALADTERSSS